MSERSVILEKEGLLAVITLNRPEKLNAFDIEMMAAIDTAATEVASDDGVRAVIITGAGKAFCAGADVSVMNPVIARKEGTPGWAKGSLTRRGDVGSAVLKLADMRKPVIAAINGVAAGGGLSLALACDIRVASEDASFGLAQVKRGIVPDMGCTYFLTRAIGMGRAMKLALTGDMIKAAEAKEWGLVDEVVPGDRVMAAARDLAARILRNPPLAVGMTKAALYRGSVEEDLAAQMKYESYVINALSGTEDFKEAIASFLEKRPPEFKGR